MSERDFKFGLTKREKLIVGAMDDFVNNLGTINATMSQHQVTEKAFNLAKIVCVQQLRSNILTILEDQPRDTKTNEEIRDIINQEMNKLNVKINVKITDLITTKVDGTLDMDERARLANQVSALATLKLKFFD